MDFRQNEARIEQMERDTCAHSAMLAVLNWRKTPLQSYLRNTAAENANRFEELCDEMPSLSLFLPADGEPLF